MKLKLKNLILVLVTGTAFTANQAKAQTNSPIHIGIKGGTSFSDLSLSKGNLDSKYSLGYYAGVFTRFDVSRLYLQGELLYSQKRSKIENGNTGYEKVKWNSIEVPVLAGYRVFKSDDVAVRIFGGGVYSYTLNDKASVLKQVSQSFQKFDRSNIGYQAGAGIDFGRLSLDLKYEGALTHISSEFKAKPDSFQASIGFMLF